jgi:hypothetical protein
LYVGQAFTPTTSNSPHVNEPNARIKSPIAKTVGAKY